MFPQVKHVLYSLSLQFQNHRARARKEKRATHESPQLKTTTPEDACFTASTSVENNEDVCTSDTETVLDSGTDDGPYYAVSKMCDRPTL